MNWIRQPIGRQVARKKHFVDPYPLPKAQPDDLDEWLRNKARQDILFHEFSESVKMMERSIAAYNESLPVSLPTDARSIHAKFYCQHEHSTNTTGCGMGALASYLCDLCGRPF